MQERLHVSDDELRSSIRLRTLASTTSAVVWYTGADGQMMGHNPSWEAFTGQRPDQYFGWRWLAAVHPDDAGQLFSAVQNDVASQRPAEATYRLRRHDGEYRHMAAQVAPIKEGGVIQEWVGISVDMTDKLSAENALKASEERLRFLDQLGQETRDATDADRVMAIATRMLGQYLGAMRCAYADVESDNNCFTIRNNWVAAGARSSVGVYSLDLFGAVTTSRLREGRHLVIRNVDSELRDDDGGTMFKSIGVKAVICAALVKDGRLKALMSVSHGQPRDWTNHEIALVGEVVDRCWAHIERARDNALLREQDRRKDEFLAILAHELRNPLAPIRYAAETLRMAADAETLNQARGVIGRQVGMMARLIDDLLDVSRINRGLIELNWEHARLEDLMRQAVETSRPGIDAAGHRLVVEPPSEDLMLQVDPARVIQAIGNLLNNAAKYTPHGGKIRLSARREGATAVLQVQDNGMGIPPDQQPRLFLKFSQLGHTAERAQGGLGLGLALVKTLIEMHGGSVRSDSPGVGRGSTFTLVLPMVQPIGIMQGGMPRRDAIKDQARPRVLVVEDNPDSLASLLALLGLLGYEAAGAADGAEALGQARRFLPQAVLLDLDLPSMSGLEVARAIRQDEKLHAVFLVALTGLGSVNDRRRTEDAGFDAHLTKPVEPDVLQRILDGRERSLARALTAGLVSNPENV